MKKNISILTSSFFAHRGIFNNKDIPENSIEAFKIAKEKGYNIELDVRLTKDNKVVVFHDASLLRMCNINKKIENLTYSELKEYKLLETKYTIPLLEDVLKIIDKQTVLLIETKTDKFNSKLEYELSKILDNYDGLFAIQSFNYMSINWFKKHRKNYIIGVLASDFKNKKINKLYKFISKKLLFDIVLNVDFISFDIRALPNKYIDKKRKKKPILGWTIRNNKKYLDKFDSIIFE